jgi:hypothetical protein
VILFLNDSCVAHNGVRKQNTLRQQWLYRIQLHKKSFPSILVLFIKNHFRQQYHLLMSFNEKTIAVNKSDIVIKWKKMKCFAWKRNAHLTQASFFMPNQAYFYWKSIRRTSKPALFFFMPNQASFAWKANSADSNDKKQYYPIKS